MTLDRRVPVASSWLTDQPDDTHLANKPESVDNEQDVAGNTESPVLIEESQIQEKNGHPDACHTAGPASLDGNEKLRTKSVTRVYLMIPNWDEDGSVASPHLLECNDPPWRGIKLGGMLTETT